MIIDDDEIILEITRDWLEGSGYDVSLRQSALGTTAAIMRERPDVLLVDVSMPLLMVPRSRPWYQARKTRADRDSLFGTFSSELDQLASRCGAFGGIPKRPAAACFSPSLSAWSKQRAVGRHPSLRRLSA